MVGRGVGLLDEEPAAVLADDREQCAGKASADASAMRTRTPGSPVYDPTSYMGGLRSAVGSAA